MGNAAVPQVDKRKRQHAYGCGRGDHETHPQQPSRPRDICTRAALDNAHRRRRRHAGSTNAVLHMLSHGAASRTPATIDDFEPILARTPVFVDLSRWRFLAARCR